MRIKAFIVCIILVVAPFCGCARRDAGESTVQPEQSLQIYSEFQMESSHKPVSSRQQEDIPSPAAELRIQGELTIYRLYVDSDIFEPYTINVQDPDLTLLDIAREVEKHLDVTLPVKTITQQKGMVVADFDGSFIELYGKAEINVILTSLAATLQQNHISFEWIQYRLDGETGVFGELWDIPPLKLIEGSEEEYAAIRAKIPYGGLQDSYWLEKPIIETDDTGWRLTHFLIMLGLFDSDIASPAEIDNIKALQTVIGVTKWYTTYPGIGDAEHYAPELKPFEAPASELLGFAEDWFWLKEHVEESARLLYGEDYRLKHGDFGKYRYVEKLGVYTPPHMGGDYGVIPVIFGYEDTGDTYIIEASYLIDSMGGYFDPDIWDWEKPIAEKDLKHYAETEAKRREIVLKKYDGGRLAFMSHRYI